MALPVGLGIRGLLPDGRDGTIPITLYAVQQAVAGKDVDAISRFAKTAPEFPVYGFSGRIDAKLLFSMMKRVQIKVLYKAYEDANVVEYSPPD